MKEVEPANVFMVIVHSGFEDYYKLMKITFYISVMQVNSLKSN